MYKHYPNRDTFNSALSCKNSFNIKNKIEQTQSWPTNFYITSHGLKPVSNNITINSTMAEKAQKSSFKSWL